MQTCKITIFPKKNIPYQTSVSLPSRFNSSQFSVDSKGVEIPTFLHRLPVKKWPSHTSPLLTVLQLSHILSHPLPSNRKTKQYQQKALQPPNVLSQSFQVTRTSWDRALHYLYKQITLLLRSPSFSSLLRPGN